MWSLWDPGPILSPQPLSPGVSQEEPGEEAQELLPGICRPGLRHSAMDGAARGDCSLWPRRLGGQGPLPLAVLSQQRRNSGISPYKGTGRAGQSRAPLPE